MSEDQQPASPASESESVPPAKGQRSSTERALVWGGILTLLLIVVVEFRAQRGYSKSLEAFSNAADSDDYTLTMSEAESFMVMAPGREHTAVNGIENTYAYTWLSLFKYGQFQLNVVYTSGDDPSLLRFWTGSGHDPMTPVVIKGKRSRGPRPGEMPTLSGAGTADMTTSVSVDDGNDASLSSPPPLEPEQPTVDTATDGAELSDPGDVQVAGETSADDPSDNQETTNSTADEGSAP
jgi:hypothetical protein